MAKLIFVGEKFGGRVYEFALPKTTIGRGDHNTLTIHDPSLSQTHCEVLVYGPEVIVRDLGSSNGTFVNGVKLHNQQCQLKAGQSVKFGLVEARLEVEAASPDTSTDETAIHSYVQYLRDQKQAPKKPAIPSMTLDPGPESIPADQTLIIPRPTYTGETKRLPGP